VEDSLDVIAANICRFFEERVARRSSTAASRPSRVA